MAKIKLFFGYDGTHYNGWQRQKNTSQTIQEVLESKLSQIANARVHVQASGRTDAGVHARIQVAHAEVPDSLLKLLVPSATPGQEGRSGDSRLKQGLNGLLPADIRLFQVEEASPHFHAQRDVLKKTYLYFIDPSPLQVPELRDYSWHLRLPLNWEAIEEAAHSFVGRHDFKAFCASDSSAKTTVRTVFEARVGTVPWHGVGYSVGLRCIRVTGSGFLKNMVRSIVGTLVQIGGGKSSPSLVAELLETRHRPGVGPTAPARGLWLWDILYRPTGT